MQEFMIQPKVYFGANALDFLKGYGTEKILIVTDPFMVESNLIDLVTEKLKGSELTIFSDVVPDPPTENIMAGFAVLAAKQPRVLIAFGGGSAIDTAKAMVLFAKKSGKIGDVVFVAIPTTSGTGSEVTAFTVVSDPAKGTKHPLVSSLVLPDVAILATELVKTVPKPIVADTGIDVLTHALEAFVSTKANVFTDSMAEKAIDLVFTYLLLSYEGDDAAKEKMHQASCLAGLAFNATSLGVNHSIAHTIGARFKLPHGRANSLLLPHVIAFNSNIKGYNKGDYDLAAVKYSQIAKKLGLGGTSVKTGVSHLILAIKSLQKQLHLPACLKDCGISNEAFEKQREIIADFALQDGCLATNPRAVTKADIIEILNQTYK